jgi:hypothetical protein
MLKAAPLAHLGYHQYTHITQAWDMNMALMPDDTARGPFLAESIAMWKEDEKKEQIRSLMARCVYSVQREFNLSVKLDFFFYQSQLLYWNQSCSYS